MHRLHQVGDYAQSLAEIAALVARAQPHISTAACVEVAGILQREPRAKLPVSVLLPEHLADVTNPCQEALAVLGLALLNK